MKTAYEEKTEAKLDQLKANIALLEARAKEKKADFRLEYREEISELQGKLEETRRKLQSLSDQTEAAWDEVKEGINDAVSELSSSVGNAMDRLKQ